MAAAAEDANVAAQLLQFVVERLALDDLQSVLFAEIVDLRHGS